MESKTAIFSANRGYALTSSRTLLIQHFLSSDWNVVLATSDDAESQSLCEMGARLEPVVFNRGGFSPLTDIQAYQRLLVVYKKWRPALVQNFHAKPVILGPLAARPVLGDQVRVVNTITGLGHAVIAGGITSRLAGMGYRLARGRTDATVFQNKDDLGLFLEKRWVKESGAKLIPGSGVDVDRFQMVDRRGRDMRSPVVVMLGRLLRQKGIPEFIEVARRIKKDWPQSRFVLAGEEDPMHPDAVTAEWVQEQSFVEYLGRLSDVQPLLARADVLLFPSYYREGLPRVVLEAAATGLPTVAFDVPGVREAVQHNETGYLVEDRDVNALTQKVRALLEDEEKRLQMGLLARDMVEKKFDIRAIKDQYLNIYNEIRIKI
ncbi:MAG: glycosyltransferase family 4 protein [Desulfobacteraceae bacterium]|nr:glycosyltransferase family 4 protein [Desulfobacteraceae bacterium]